MRRNYYTGKYALDVISFLHAKYYALKYKRWRDEYDALADSSRAITYDGDGAQGSDGMNVVERNGIRRAELAKKMEVIEQTAIEVDAQMYPWILQGVTDDFATFTYLKMMKGMPCSRNTYYNLRRKFYFLLDKKI